MIDHSTLDDLEILCEIDISALAHQPSSTFYRRIQPHIQSAYQDRQRFILYAFSPVPSEVLQHVINVLQLMDISHYFVRVFTDQEAVQRFFQCADPPMLVEWHSQPVISESGHTVPLFPSSVMCAHAWSGLHINIDGSAKVCCDFKGLITDGQGRPYNLQTHTFYEIMESEYMNSIRDQFRNGVTPKQCMKCSEYEKKQSTSKRSVSQFKLSNIYPYIDWESNKTPESLFVAAHTGNLCNLKCRNCNPALSSKIAAEELQFGEASKRPLIREIIKQNHWHKDRGDVFWNLMRQDERFCNFELMGGETLMLEENIRLMQHLIDTGRSEHCIFEIITNGTVFPDVLDRSNQFHRLSITLSIDDIGERFEYQRSGASWNQVTGNIQKWQSVAQRSQGMHLNVCVTISLQNVLYLPELLFWLRTHGLTNYYLNLLRWPESLSVVQNLTSAARDAINEKYSVVDLDQQDHDNLQYVLKEINSCPVNDGQEFCDYIRNKDFVRDEDYAAIHPEMARAMGYSKYR